MCRRRRHIYRDRNEKKKIQTERRASNQQSVFVEFVWNDETRQNITLFDWLIGWLCRNGSIYYISYVVMLTTFKHLVICSAGLYCLQDEARTDIPPPFAIDRFLAKANRCVLDTRAPCAVSVDVGRVIPHHIWVSSDCVCVCVVITLETVAFCRRRRKRREKLINHWRERYICNRPNDCPLAWRHWYGSPFIISRTQFCHMCAQINVMFDVLIHYTVTHRFRMFYSLCLYIYYMQYTEEKKNNQKFMWLAHNRTDVLTCCCMMVYVHQRNSISIAMEVWNGSMMITHNYFSSFEG